MPSQSLNSDRIKVNIAIDHKRALLRVVQDGFETPLKKRAAPVMQPIVPSTEGEIEPWDGSTQVVLQRLNLEMVMIAYQDVGMDS